MTSDPGWSPRLEGISTPHRDIESHTGPIATNVNVKASGSTTEQMINARPDIYVFIRILGLLAKADYLKSKLGMASNTNHATLSNHLGIMEDFNLIITNVTAGGHLLVTITKKGRQAHEELSKWISPDGIKPPPSIVQELFLPSKEKSDDIKK